MADGKRLRKESTGVADTARSPDMDTKVKSEPADVDEDLDEGDVYSVKQELDIGPVVLQPPDLSHMLLPCKPEPGDDASPIEPGHLIKNEPNAEPTHDNIAAVRSLRSAKYICDICSKSYVRKMAFQLHLISHKREPYQCHICKKIFRWISFLNRHMLIHTGERPYMCDICKKTFSHKASVYKHMFIHTGELPHKCYVCNKGFSIKSNLNLHMLSHPGEGPHECNICKKYFLGMSLLSKHMLTHTGKRPKCDI